jgi:predicted ArsR family transcriptional regulator
MSAAGDTPGRRARRPVGAAGNGDRRVTPSAGRVVDPEVARHRALGDSSRGKLLRALAASEEPLDAHVLARQVGLHVNTVRWHLGVLLDAGLVTADRSGSGAPGRPRLGYRLQSGAGARDGLELFAEILVDALAHQDGDAAGSLEAAGRARGRTLVRPRFGGERGVGFEEAVGTLVRLLQGLGFQARSDRDADGEFVAVKPCPFGEMASRHSSIVCPVHLGLMRGVFDALRAPVEATSLEPFVTPHLCVGRLRPAAT